MNRREFFTTAGLLTATTYMSACASNDSATLVPIDQVKPVGAVTLYHEFKIAGPAIQNMMTAMGEQGIALDAKTGFLNFTLKLMVGDSTMVNNLLADTGLKGVLKSAYYDAAAAGKRAFTYALLIRFDSYDNMMASDVETWFTDTIKPLLFVYAPGTPPTKTALALDYYKGVYQTIAAGDANGIYQTQEEIVTFLSTQQDMESSVYQPIPLDGTTSGASISVKNHVAISDINTDTINTMATALLTVAQQTYQPETNVTNGTSGTLSDSNYRKAVTTEILQNAFAYGEMRNYLFHGVWESVADHENSHIDPRFMAAANPVGAYVIAGPSEPFYQTMILHNKL
ncbi:MAG: hypothetical protein ACI9TV_000140 [Sulfurimonas sp.]|jgi:hypothetical protein|uniref:hypothetical protein n=1 Tax=Sulfurimonas sp. TaxID=2022749 RepID=UPI0039E54A8D